MTAAEVLIAQGEARGRAEGRAEGEVRGRAEGEARGAAIGQIQILKQMLGRRVEPIEAFAGVGLDRLTALAAELQQELRSR